jgi:O-acetyl-ADP-ribose deacetylase (regulator of RNase III)
MPIKYVTGDATNPTETGRKIIVHVVNNQNRWGRGFVLALSKKWKLAEEMYRKWGKEKVINGNEFKLGNVQFVKVDPEIVIANMVGQHGVETENGVPPVRYDAIRECLRKVCSAAQKNNAVVIGPKFGAGLAGGTWSEIEKTIEDELCSKGVGVTIYELAT